MRKMSILCLMKTHLASAEILALKNTLIYFSGSQTIGGTK